jgi:hypothetical protein
MALVGFRDRGCAEDVHTIFVALSSWKPFFFHGLSPASQTTWEHKTPESNKSDGRYPNFLKFSLTLLDEKLGVEHANSQVLYN